MIRKGLKKGDKFEDGGRLFIIEEVLETGNYLSREIKEEDIIEEETPAEEAEEETPAEEAEEAPAEEVKTEQPAPKKTRTKKTKEA